ncbi:MAG: hypothetical protein FJ220_06220, partial [Kiritimatiellaceae bacterium]|nr:hypothetical protein [Kiritimatiellaceae bacterium]
MKLYRICIASKLICIMASAGLCADSPVDLFADLEDWNGTPVVTSSEAAPSTNEIADPTSVICTEPDYPSTPASPPPVRAPIDLDDLFSQGKERYAEEDWTVAQQRFEAVLQQDPYHDGATKWLKRTLDKQTAAEKKQTLNTRAHMLETVQAAWNTPKTIHEIPPNENQPRELSEQDQQALRLQDKLETIRIPQLAFQATDIQRVIEELATRCRELDPEQSGVNIILFGTADISVAPVTFTGNNLSAREALDIVTQISGMKYEVGATCVRVTPVHYESPQQMVAAEFDLTPAVGKKLASRSSTQPGGLCDVRDFFTTIPFPVGSSAHYNPEFNVLLVRHSPKYIDHVSAILERYKRKELEERSRQVEIETKFIEVEQGALDELGFNWTVGEAGDTMTAGALGMPGGQNLFTDSLRDGQESFATGINPADRASSFNSYANETYNPTGSGLVGTASELMVQKIKGAPVDLVIRALERMSGSDLLSAPKILTKSGEVARIHVGEVHWFPSAYDVEIERYAQ